jgi:hypothetical protein
MEDKYSIDELREAFPDSSESTGIVRTLLPADPFRGWVGSWYLRFTGEYLISPSQSPRPIRSIKAGATLLYQLLAADQ